MLRCQLLSEKTGALLHVANDANIRKFVHKEVSFYRVEGLFVVNEAKKCVLSKSISVPEDCTHDENVINAPSAASQHGGEFPIHEWGQPVGGQADLLPL